MTTKSIIYEGGRIFYSMGKRSDKAVFFCHGDAQNRTAGTTTVESFPPEYMRLGADFPGHGFSDEIPERSLEKESDLIKKILEAEGAEQAILTGHSKGANLAATFAIQNPELIQSLVLINPFFTQPKHAFWFGMIPGFIGFAERQYLKSAKGKYQEQKMHIYGREQTEEEIREIGLSHTPYTVLKHNLRLYDNYDIREPISSLDKPILILTTQGTFTPKRHLKQMARKMKRARLETIAGSHNAHLLTPDQVTEKIKANLDFLTKA